MTARVALVALVLAGACKDSHRNDVTRVEPTRRAALRGASVPTLAPASIDNLDAVPPEARERIASTMLAIVENRSTDFLDTLSTGGFTIGSLALTREQAEAELAGRTVAELTNVACAQVDACRWSVAARSDTELELEARANGTLVGAVELVHEDDGSWGVAGARPMVR